MVVWVSLELRAQCFTSSSYSGIVSARHGQSVSSLLKLVESSGFKRQCKKRRVIRRPNAHEGITRVRRQLQLTRSSRAGLGRCHSLSASESSCHHPRGVEHVSNLANRSNKLFVSCRYAEIDTQISKCSPTGSRCLAKWLDSTHGSDWASILLQCAHERIDLYSTRSSPAAVPISCVSPIIWAPT